MQHLSSSIEVLPPHVVEKIAAGEVIERPASVLKELVENAIDAGATAIDAAIEAAGFSVIRVVDNGNGMSPIDLGKSVLPHATSKIRTADDLFAVTTMGFRGEALASIAAVSRLRITSSAETGGLGAEFTNDGITDAPVRPVSHARGTAIEVRDLFYNVPARKKFMKSSRGEQLAAIRVMEQVAVPFPSIHFTMTVDGRRVLDTHPVDSPLARIASIAGMEFAKGLIECRGSRAGMEAAVYVSSPRGSLQTRPRYQSLYVNLRRVDCDSVTYAVREAFEQFLSGHFRPSFFCFLDIDPSRIDVNVHPTKQQVKFDDERSLFGFIFATVKQGIGGSLPAAADVFRPDEESVPREDARSDAPGAPAPAPVQEKLRFAGTATTPNRFSAPPETASRTAMDRERSGGEAQAGKSQQRVIPFLSASPVDHKRIDQPGNETVQLSKDRETEWDLISCYQIHEIYILAQIKNGILLIDQHAAHERILYEQALEDIAKGRSTSQQLLFPVVVELSAVEKTVVTAGQSFFAAFGFEVSDFGGNALSVSSLPFFMRVSDVEETMRSMVRYLLEEKERDAVHETEKRFAAAFACGAAIKAGQKLSQEEMNALVNSLFATKNPYICPHGRPTLVRISLDELSRRFLR